MSQTGANIASGVFNTLMVPASFNPVVGGVLGATYGATAAKDMADNGVNWGNGLQLGLSALPLGRAGYRGFRYAWDATVPTRDLLRREILSHKQLGIYTPYKVGQKWQWDANGKLFGKRIGEGSEMDVFENLENPEEVLKIQSQGYPSLAELKKGVRFFQKRNYIPYQERARFQGYMLGPDAATRTKQVYYPVFSQKRLKLETNTTPAYWEKVLVPRIDRMMHKKGFKGTALQTFTNGKYTISDMSPQNIGYNENGNLRFLDFYTE